MSKDFRDIDYLGHIRDAITKIQRYVNDKSEAEFMASELIQDGVIRHLEVIGEAVSKLSPGLKAAYPEAPGQPLARCWYKPVGWCRRRASQRLRSG